MFHNIIYFLVVLVVYNIDYPGGQPKEPLIYSIAMMGAGWLLFGAYCSTSVKRVLGRALGERGGIPKLAGEYQALTLRLSLLAVFLFALDVHLFNLKYWLGAIPGLGPLTVLQGLLALGLFVLYQCTIWYFSHPLYSLAFLSGVERKSFVLTNARLNIPILFPWFTITLIYDLLSLTPLARPDSFFFRVEGQILFFAFLLAALVVFLPPLVQYWWGCRPLEPSEKTRAVKSFLEERNFRYRGLLNWPIFEGRMLTAGIMGIVPRFRYILLTKSLMEILSIEELKAVTAHEMGHARHRHMLYYTVFFLGFMVLSIGLMDLFGPLVGFLPFMVEGLSRGDTQTLSLYYFMTALPFLVSLLVYFRFLMGFFMRHFERQADLYSAEVMGSPVPTINSLEKIALMSGKIRELPSWHHFSIAQRVDYLQRTLREPGLIRRHRRFVASVLGIYFVCMIGLGLALNSAGLKDFFTLRLAIRSLTEQVQKEPENPALSETLGRLYHEMDRLEAARGMYERTLALDPDQPTVLNNLAWLLVTAEEETLRDPERALVLARKAVTLERSPVFLDILAEALFLNGRVEEALEAGAEAVSLATENRRYYRDQMKRFEAALGRE